MELLVKTTKLKAFYNFTTCRLYIARPDDDADREAFQKRHAFLSENRFIANILKQAKAKGIDETLLSTFHVRRNIGIYSSMIVDALHARRIVYSFGPFA